MNVVRDISFFFEKRKVFEFFSALGRRIVIFWRWISNRLSIMRFSCLDELFQDCLFSENNLTVWYFLSEFERNFFKKLEKWNFYNKYQHGCHNWIPRFQGDSLPNFSPEKNQLQKRFRSLSGSSLCFVEKIRQVREKCITASRRFCWGKYVFLCEMLVYNCFPVGEIENVGLRQKKIQQQLQVCVFICVKNLFPGECFFLQKANNLLSVLRFRDIFIKSLEAGKNYVLMTK